MSNIKDQKKDWSKARGKCQKKVNGWFLKGGACFVVSGFFAAAGLHNWICGERGDAYIKTVDFVLDTVEKEA